MTRLAFILALLCVACTNSMSGPLDTGTWGGEGIRLTVTMSNIVLEFDCASAEITSGVELTGGIFSATGTFTLEHGGPIREGEPADVRPATFSGSVSGDRMKIAIAVQGPTPLTLGDYRLLRNAPPILHKCQ